MDGLLTLTLTLIAAVESNSGRDILHEPVRNPASIHFNEVALGRYGLMPATLRLEGATNEEEAARAHLKRLWRIRPSSRCPLDALSAWERGARGRRGGPNAVKRAIRAKVEFRARGATSDTWTTLRAACGDHTLFVWASM